MEEREATQFEFTNKLRPMNEEEFADIELAIRSLRDMAYEHLIVDFQNKIDKLDFMQACSIESYKTCYIEIGFIREGKNFPQIYAIEGVTVEKAVEIFKSVCCSSTKPDLSEWNDRTQEILENEGIEDK